MKKRWSIVLILCCFVFILGGCGAQIPDMTEEERKAISEYAAGLLLKYDTSQPSRLVDLEALEEAENTPEPTQTPEADVQVTPEPGEQVTSETDQPTVPENTEGPEEQPDEGRDPVETPQPESWDPLESTLLLPEGVTLQLLGYEAVDVYQEETVGNQEVKAEQGRKILVFRFVMTNNSDLKQEIDMLQDNIRYKVYVQDELINGMLTMIENDLTTYIGSIEAKEALELFLFAEAEEELLQGGTDIYLEFMCKEMVSRIEVE